MKILPSVFLVLALACPCVAAATEEEINKWKQQAEAGDAKAARQLMLAYGPSDIAESLKWRNKAVELGDAEECLRLVHSLRAGVAGVKAVGATPQEAVRKLLTLASATSGIAAYELGEAYREGYLVGPDKEQKMREAYQQAAALNESRSWSKLAEMLHQGYGGAADPVEACYHAGLATRFTSPGSDEANQLWVLRRDTEARLTLAKLKQVWKRLDAFTSEAGKRDQEHRLIAQRSRDAAVIAEMKWYHWRSETDALEQRHRADQERIKGRQEAIATGGAGN